MKKIALNRNLFTLVDDEDFVRISKYKWYALTNSSTTYAVRHVYKNKKRTLQMMHRFILKLNKSKLVVDHKDGNGLNNQKNNIRIATNSENGYNTKIFKSNTTGYKGVTWNKQQKCFRAFININKKSFYLGRFKTAKEASNAYEEKAKERGEFHRKTTKERGETKEKVKKS